MEAKYCRQQTPTTHGSGLLTKRHEQGFTLVELLISMLILGVILAAAFSVFQSTNSFVEADTGRVTASQNTQGALDILVADVRQAGENLDLRLGITGLEFNNVSQTMTIRRSIPALVLEQTPTEPALVGQTVKSLPLCAVNGSSIQVVGPPPSSATASNVCTYTTRPDNDDASVKPWRVYLASEESRPQAAVLSRPANLVTGIPALVQSVVVTAVGAPATETVAGAPIRRISVTLRDPVPAGFTVANNSTLTLLDERRYFLNNDELLLALGGQTTANASKVAFNTTGFTISANLVATTTAPIAPATTVSAIALTDFPFWKRLAKVNISLTSGTSGQGRDKATTFKAAIYPRNVESAQ